jgi:hypothetical protein
MILVYDVPASASAISAAIRISQSVEVSAGPPRRRFQRFAVLALSKAQMPSNLQNGRRSHRRTFKNDRGQDF